MDGIGKRISALLGALVILITVSPTVASGQDYPASVPTSDTITAPVSNAAPATSPSNPAENAAAPAVANRADDNVEPATSSGGFLEIVQAAGIVGLLIVLLSIAAVALVIEHILTIRQTVLVPEPLGDTVHDLLGAGRLGPAVESCRETPSFLAQVLESGIIEIENGWQSVEKAVEDAIAEQAARLYRKIEYLSVIGNIAPMLGLLGTVIGMILAFRVLADSQGAASPIDLAEGIYQALVTTVLGLIVAIPSLGAFAVFRNRIDHMTAEVAFIAQHTFGPVKRMLLQGENSGMVQSTAAVKTSRLTPSQPPNSPPGQPPLPPRSSGGSGERGGA